MCSKISLLHVYALQVGEVKHNYITLRPTSPPVSVAPAIDDMADTIMARAMQKLWVVTVIVKIEIFQRVVNMHYDA